MHTIVLPEQEIHLMPESGISDIVRQIPSLNLHGDQSSMVAIPRDQIVVITGPSGTFCNDDFYGLNPGISAATND